MVTTLYLIRHGATEGAEARRYKGAIDVPLSQDGIRQIEKVAAFLRETVGQKDMVGRVNNQTSAGDISTPGSSLAGVYCSDLSRAIKSAEIITEPWSLRPVVRSSLRERNFGLWEGMSFDEIRERYPEEFAAWAENPLKFSPMGGESTIRVKERVMSSFREIIEHHQGESVAIVSHGGVNRVILCEILGIPLEHIFRVEQDYGCLNIVEFWDAYPVVKLINGVVHG